MQAVSWLGAAAVESRSKSFGAFAVEPARRRYLPRPLAAHPLDQADASRDCPDFG